MTSKFTGRTTNAVESRTSRYVQGGLTNRHPTRLGWWERKIIGHKDDDIRITLTSSEAGRPDTVAHRYLGDSKLTWLVLQYNNIIDIETEFTIGKEIRLPSQRRVALDILTGKTGGNTNF